MKKLVVLAVMAALIVSRGVGVAEEDSAIKGGLSGVVSGVVSAGKDAISGIVAGVDEGRKSGDSADGAKIVSNKTELAAMLRVAVLKVEDMGDQRFQLTIGFYNDNEFPVRLAKLSEVRSVVLLDTEGFSYTLTNPLAQGTDVTVLGKSATRVRYIFSGVEGKPSTFRLFDENFPIAEAKD